MSEMSSPETEVYVYSNICRYDAVELANVHVC